MKTNCDYIADARQICEEVCGDLSEGEAYGSIQIAKILSIEVFALRAIIDTLNAKLAACEDDRFW